MKDEGGSWKFGSWEKLTDDGCWMTDVFRVVGEKEGLIAKNIEEMKKAYPFISSFQHFSKNTKKE